MTYGGWKQTQAAGQQKTKDDDVVDQADDDDNDDEPEQDRARDVGANVHDDHVGAADDEPATSGGSTASRLMARVGPVVRGTRAAARQGVTMARRYPRVSMASGLSAAILGAVVILQPGKGKHDTTAQIPSAPLQTTAPSQTQTAKTDPPVSSTPSASAPKADDPALGPAEKSGTLAANDLPLVAGDLNSADGKGQSNSPSNEVGLLSGMKTEPAVAPDKKVEVPGPLPVGEPVKLTAGEGLVALPPVGEPLATPGENQGPGQVVDLAPAPGPAPARTSHGAGRGRCETRHATGQSSCACGHTHPCASTCGHTSPYARRGELKGGRVADTCSGSDTSTSIRLDAAAAGHRRNGWQGRRAHR